MQRLAPGGLPLTHVVRVANWPDVRASRDRVALAALAPPGVPLVLHLFTA